MFLHSSPNCGCELRDGHKSDITVFRFKKSAAIAHAHAYTLSTVYFPTWLGEEGEGAGY